MLHKYESSHRRSALSTECVLSHSVVSDSGLEPTRLFCPWNSPGKNTGVGCHSLLQGSFPNHRLNQSLLPCRQILHHLSHQKNPKVTFQIQIWVFYHFIFFYLSVSILSEEEKWTVNLQEITVTDTFFFKCVPSNQRRTKRIKLINSY